MVSAPVGMGVVGFIVGLVARAVMPGSQNLGFVLTSVRGIVGSLMAGFLGQASIGVSASRTSA